MGFLSSRIFWASANFLCFVIGVVFLSQTILFYSSMSEIAVEAGKKVVIQVDTAEVTMREIEEEEEETEELTDILSDESPETKEEAETATQTTEETAPIEQPRRVSSGNAPVAVVMVNLGLDENLTKAVMKMPGNVSLSFSPYAANAGKWVQKGLEARRDVFLDLPMETDQYPFQDPGPYALSTTAGKAKNLFRLKSTLSVADGFIGLFSAHNEKITHLLTSILPLIDEVKKNNLIFMYNQKRSNAFLQQEARAIGLPVIAGYMVVDEVLTQRAIDAKLEEATKRIIEDREPLVLVGRPYPLTIKRLNAWLESFQKDYWNIVPASELVIK